MKKWTVMLIPHDRNSNTRTINLSSFHFNMAVFLVLVLAFTAAFFYKRWDLSSRELVQVEDKLKVTATDLDEMMKRLENSNGVDPEVLANFERQIRAEYDARDSALNAVLSELYDQEARFREINGLAPRQTTSIADIENADGGVGGPPDELGDETIVSSDVLMRPPNVIYGLMSPSADLIVQEINLRTRSLRELLEDVETEKDRLERLPTFWPTNEQARRISSRFGPRKDPFTKRNSFHHGLDIVAQYGSPVLATARGEIIEASRDKHKGNYVKIDHGFGFQTTYLHLKKVAVKRGDKIERGDIIGQLGNTGRSKGAHIHYEVTKSGKRVNPADYLGN